MKRENQICTVGGNTGDLMLLDIKKIVLKELFLALIVSILLIINKR